MGQIKCEVKTSWGSDMFTIEVRTKDGKIYQKRSSVLHAQGAWDKIESPVNVLLYVNYGDVITAARGSGSIYLKDESADDFSGKAHLLSVKPNPADKREVKEVTVTKENVLVPPHKFTNPDPKAKKEYRPSRSVWDA